LWLETVESNVRAGDNAQATHDYYLAKIAALVSVFGRDFLLGQIDSSAATDAYVAKRRASVGKHTVKKELDVLRWALQLARRRKLWTGIIDDVLPVNYSADYQPRVRVVPPLELQRLLPRLEQDNAARAAWMVATSGEWGASTRALRADFAGGAFRVRGTKNPHRDRTVPITTAWQKSLIDYALANAQGADGLLFRAYTRNVLFQDLRRACRDLELAPCCANDLRRTCATWLLADGVSWDDVAKMLGHVDTRMLHKVYGRIGVDELRARLKMQLGLADSRAVADGAGTAGTGGKVGMGNTAERGETGVADGARTRNTWSHSPAWFWPKGRESLRMGARRAGGRSSGVARLVRS